MMAQKAHKAVISACLDSVIGVPVLTPGEQLGTQPAAIRSSAVVTAPQLYVAAVVLQ